MKVKQRGDWRASLLVVFICVHDPYFSGTGFSLLLRM